MAEMSPASLYGYLEPFVAFCASPCGYLEPYVFFCASPIVAISGGMTEAASLIWLHCFF